MPRVSDAVANVGGEHRRLATFVRGLTIGALVGAAIAGSALLERRRERRHRLEHTIEELPPPRSD